MLNIRSEIKDHQAVASFQGPVDEHAAKALSDLLPQVAGCVTIVLNLAGVEYFNSLGIRAWVNFLKVLVEGRRVCYEACPSDMVQQMNMMPAMSRGVEVLSFYADFRCNNCGHEQSNVFSCSKGRSVLQQQFTEQACERCGGQLQLEEEPKTLLLFMKS